MNINTWSRNWSPREAALTTGEGALDTERGKKIPWFLPSFCPPIFRECLPLAESCWKPVYSELGSEGGKVYPPFPHSPFNKAREKDLRASMTLAQALAVGVVCWVGWGVGLGMCSVYVLETEVTLVGDRSACGGPRKSKSRTVASDHV